MPLVFPALTATTQEHQQTKDESGCVPAAVVVSFIDADVRVEQGDDQSERRDEAVPHSQLKTGGLSFNAGGNH